MDTISCFNYNGEEMSVIEDHTGNLLFDSKFLCKQLGYSSEPSNILREFKEPSEKQIITKEELPVFFTGSFASQKTLVTEKGLYKLLARSNKTKAEPFQDWLFGEVLPSIRKTGSYSLKQELTDKNPIARAEPDFDSALRIATKLGLDINRARIAANQAVKESHGMNLRQVLGVDLIEDKQETLYTPTELGRMLEPKLSAIKFNQLLERFGLQCKISGKWVLTDKGRDYGKVTVTEKAHSKGDVQQIKWLLSVLGFLN